MKLFFFFYFFGFGVFAYFLVPQKSKAQSITNGSLIYNDFCYRCHGVNGVGRDNLIPPLKSSDYLLKNIDLSIAGLKYGLKGEIIVKTSTKIITAPFSGNVGTRGISSSILGTNSIIVTLDDSKRILCDLQIPEVFAAILKKGLKVNAKFLAYKDKSYGGIIVSHASRIDAQTRSILARAQIDNKNLEILPGSLLDIELLYEEKEALSVADTSIIFEDEKKFVYKVLNNNKIKKTEVKTGIRKKGNLEILEGLNTNDKIVKEGLSRLADGMLVKPILR